MASLKSVRTTPADRNRWRNTMAAERESRSDGKAAEIPEGQVTVQRHGDGWYLVQIGRARYTKRFNLSAAEAAQLVEQLVRDGVAQGAPSALGQSQEQPDGT